MAKFSFQLVELIDTLNWFECNKLKNYNISQIYTLENNIIVVKFDPIPTIKIVPKFIKFESGIIYLNIEIFMDGIPIPKIDILLNELRKLLSKSELMKFLRLDKCYWLDWNSYPKVKISINEILKNEFPLIKIDKISYQNKTYELEFSINHDPIEPELPIRAEYCSANGGLINTFSEFDEFINHYLEAKSVAYGKNFYLFYPSMKKIEMQSINDASILEEEWEKNSVEIN